MYKTNYFKNVELSSVKSIISSLKSSARTLKSENEEVAHLFMNSTEWEGEAKNTLQKGFDNVGARINILQTKLDLFVDVLNSAMNVVELQNEMENSTDIEKLLSNASMIETYMNQIKTVVSSIKAAGGGIETVVSSSSFTSTDGFGTGVFQVNKEKFAIAKEDYNDWSNLFKVNYDSFLSTEASLSKDEYLYYAWGLICISFDHLAVKRDHIENWLEGFLTNIKTIEDGLPDKVSSITKVSTNKVAQTREYPKKPTFDSYLKSGRGSEIKEKKEEKQTSTNTNNSTQTATSARNPGGTTAATTTDKSVAQGHNGMPSNVPASAVNSSGNNYKNNNKNKNNNKDVAKGHNGMPSNVPISAVNSSGK